MNNDPLNPLAGPLGKTAANSLNPSSSQYYPGNFPANSANPNYTGNYPANPVAAGELPSNQFFTPLKYMDGGPANPANPANVHNYWYLRMWNWGLLPLRR